MASLLAGLPAEVPASTINRLCASGMDAVVLAARGIDMGDYQLAIAGGVESMSRPLCPVESRSCVQPRPADI